jgi:hypothetical protein
VVTLAGEMAVQPARGQLGAGIAVREFADYAAVELEA